MKYIVLGAALLLAGIAGGFGVSKATGTSKETSTQLNLTNHTVSPGVPTSQLVPGNPQLVTETKQVTKFAVNSKRLVYFTQDFNPSSVANAIESIQQLNKEGSEDIWLLLDSPGGSVLDGARLISVMESSKAHVNTVCMRLCASMAAMTHSYGFKRYSTDRAILMYHPASGGASGQIPNMLSLIGTIQRYVDKMNANVIKRSKIPADEFNRAVAYELWVDAEDSLQKGLIDGIASLDVTLPNEINEQHEPDEKKVGTPTPGKTFNFTWTSPYPNMWKAEATKPKVEAKK